MPGKFALSSTRNGKFSFRLHASNGEVILASQTYSSRSGARRGIASVQNHCGDGNCYERKKASNSKDYFVLKARNGQVIGKSEMYNSPRAMENGIQSVKTNGRSTVIDDLTA